jgi:hypothetical protein
MNTAELLGEITAGNITLKAALEAAFDEGNRSQKLTDHNHILDIMYSGKNIFIRTVTHHYTGKFVMVSDGFIVLEKAAWIADDGRFSDCIKTGKISEVEPYFDDRMTVSVGAIIDSCEWKHDLPRSQK